MSDNSSSSSNASLPAHHLHNLETVFDRLYHCLTSKLGVRAMHASIVINILVILPLCISIIYLVPKQLWQQHSNKRMGHSDRFTLHMAIIEVINIFSFFITFCGVYANLKEMTILGINLFPINFCGQLLFHTLTCMERYLAVVHPITYLGLTNTDRIKIRNVLLTCVWLLCFAGIGFMFIKINTLVIIVSYGFVPSALIIMSFCTISVLCILIHPKPGERVGDKQQVNQSKLRALITITLILGVLLFRFGGNILASVLESSFNLGEEEECGVLMSDYFFSFPCTLVLPLLFLHKSGKLKCCRSNTGCRLRSG